MGLWAEQGAEIHLICATRGEAGQGVGLGEIRSKELAAEIGVDRQKFQECLDSNKFAKHVEDDYQSGIRAGVTGTPGNILLNIKTGKTRIIPGAVPFEQIKPAIDAML